MPITTDEKNQMRILCLLPTLPPT